jgi:glycosyltransferase involved in cell wall biosynthesis
MSDPSVPIVSVVLPVRNGATFIAPAVDSILTQQDVSFELIVVDDGSADDTPTLLAIRSDPRMRVLRREGGGLVAALNSGIVEARGRYIARMDGDDVSLPGRLAAQVALLDADASVDLVHASANIIDETGRHHSVLAAVNMTRDERRAVLLGERAGAPIVHPTVMMRRSMIEALGGYRHSPISEDHELWLRAVDRFGFRAMPQPLLDYRHHGGGISRSRAIEQSLSNLLNAVGYRLTAARGVDLYVEAPDVQASLREWAAARFGRTLADIAEARRIRSGLRRGDRPRELWNLLRFMSRGPALLGSAAARRRLLACQHEAVTQAIRMLDATGVQRGHCLAGNE